LTVKALVDSIHKTDARALRGCRDGFEGVAPGDGPGPFVFPIWPVA
jgi:hypothetical protein